MNKRILLLVGLCAVCTSRGNDIYVVMMDEQQEGQELLPASPDLEVDLNKYSPTWESLDSRPLPTWYDEAKIGIFIHWGVFSVPSFGSEWFWKFWKNSNDKKYREFMKAHYPPNFTYQEFARDFTAEFFNATQWSKLFESSGARYVVMTSKHHEGYTMWPSRYSFGWNSQDVGPHRDLIGELAGTLRNKTDLKFGIYHSMFEWYNPMYLFDQKNNYTTDNFVTQKTIPELHELVETYKPEVIWSDGDWDATDTYWKSKEFLTWLYNDSPVRNTVLVNDRWGRNIPCNHGGFYTCSDRYNPGKLQSHKWENCMTIDKQSWGFRRNAVLSEYLSVQELVEELITTVSCGGNLLMNIGPTKDGIITPIYEERLREMGNWLKVNGEAIYKSKPWSVQNDTLTGDVWYTQAGDKQFLYAALLSWPKDNILRLEAFKPPTNSKVFLLGHAEELKWRQTSDNLQVNLPAEAHQGKPAWVVRFQQRS